jgi:hypothetical protein
MNANEKLEQLQCELGAIARESKNNNPIFVRLIGGNLCIACDIKNIISLTDRVINTEQLSSIKMPIFNDIGDLFDAEQAMLQELQEGWITYEEFNAFQDSEQLSSIKMPILITILPISQTGTFCNS